MILIPAIVNLSVPIYNRNMPELFGMPFFYWFQTVWLALCSGFYIGFAHLMDGRVKKQEGEQTLNK
ncbi:MAG: DUF3311 domain-containing protein [Nitrososphaeraceae archaeon]|nr:DUF3311 domain-containing protein [Nitrososphaeraceae archaeon]